MCFRVQSISRSICYSINHAFSWPKTTDVHCHRLNFKQPHQSLFLPVALATRHVISSVRLFGIFLFLLRGTVSAGIDLKNNILCDVINIISEGQTESCRMHPSIICQKHGLKFEVEPKIGHRLIGRVNY